MNRIVHATLAILVIAACIAAQQSGTPNRDYTINGVGSMAASHVSQNVCTPSVLSNLYTTMDPGAPVLWLYAPTGTIGWFTTATNSVDIGPIGLLSLLGGANFLGLPPAAVMTDPMGSFALMVPLPGVLTPTTHFLAMAHVAATSNDGIWLSQTHRVTLLFDHGNCTTPGVGSVVGDDSFLMHALGFAYSFYGVAYADLFVGSNGFVTFGAGDTTFTESVIAHRAGPPRIAAFWDDLVAGPVFGGAGTVTFFTDGVSTWEVCYANMPEFFNVGSNTFRVKAVAGSHIEMGYNCNLTATDCLVGLSPGFNIDPVGLALNLSAGPNAIGPGQAPYELFPGTFDLQGRLITWTTDAAGNPTGQF
jgi:hypothetical protein